ncbi:MAG: cytochrome P450 [Bradyrhizobium sp.]|nr:cytochrome P450 [Bradyrhizobium sp.]
MSKDWTEAVAFRPPAPAPPKRRLGPIGLLQALRRNPLECWSEDFFREPISRVGLPIGQVFVLNEPAAIRQVLVDNSANYRKDRLQRRVLSAGLADGLLSAEDKRWEIQRRTLAPLFSARTVRSLAKDMRFAVDRLSQRWLSMGRGTTVDVAAEITLLTLDVLALTIFSDGLPSDPDEFRLSMTEYFRAAGRIGLLDLIGAPDYIPRPGRSRIESTLQYFENIIDGLIDTRRKAIESNAACRDDLLTLLLRALDPATGQPMTLAEVRSNILTFLSAGHETTANTLAWSLFLLSQSDEWRRRVRDEAERELRGPEDGLVDRLVVTKAVIDEALRLYPPIAALSRSAKGPDRLGEHNVKAGSLIVIAPYVLHRHQQLWHQPDVFDPTRFMGDARRQVGRFAYLPFGVGPRICIGASFALQEATIALACLVQRFEFQLEDESQVWPLMSVTVRPANGLRMRIAPAAGPAEYGLVAGSAAE